MKSFSFLFDNYSLDFEVAVPKRYLRVLTTPDKLKETKEMKKIRDGYYKNIIFFSNKISVI